MKGIWWKLLGAFLILYSLLFGMKIPLKQGITQVSPNSCNTGDSVILTVKGYNTKYISNTTLKAWLKLGTDEQIDSKSIEVIDQNTLQVTFDIPNSLPTTNAVADATLIVSDMENGTALLPSAVFIQKTENKNSAKVWNKSLIKIENKSKHWSFPFRNILAETIRNTYYHVPMWMAMMMMFLLSSIYSGMYLKTFKPEYDLQSMSFNRVGVLFGFLGLVSGMFWAKNTWGQYWSWDIKQNMSAIAVLMYLAYFVLRGSFDDMERSSKIVSVYNIFAFFSLIPLLYLIPRYTDSLHPGNGGNPAFGSQDLDNSMRMIFYPAVIGWILMGLWFKDLYFRAQTLSEKVNESEQY
jgi:heme exporter protein C